MIKYFQKIKELSSSFKTYSRFPYQKSFERDALSHFATSDYPDLSNGIFIEYLRISTIEKTSTVTQVEHKPSQIDPLVNFLEKGELPDDKRQAQRIRQRALWYVLLKGSSIRSPLPCLHSDVYAFQKLSMHLRKFTKASTIVTSEEDCQPTKSLDKDSTGSLS